MNPLAPSAALLCKLGSIIVHSEELTSIGAHDFDRVALEQLLQDPDVQEWMQAMDGMAMLPKKRTMQDLKLQFEKNERLTKEKKCSRRPGNSSRQTSKSTK